LSSIEKHVWLIENHKESKRYYANIIIEKDSNEIKNIYNAIDDKLFKLQVKPALTKDLKEHAVSLEDPTPSLHAQPHPHKTLSPIYIDYSSPQARWQ
jgi:hypothetical protein